MIEIKITCLQMSDWIPLLSVDETRKEDRVPDEEDRGVVTNQVPVSFLGVELDGESPGITSLVSGARLPPDGAEADGAGSLFADLIKDLGLDKEKK